MEKPEPSTSSEPHSDDTSSRSDSSHVVDHEDDAQTPSAKASTQPNPDHTPEEQQQQQQSQQQQPQRHIFPLRQPTLPTLVVDLPDVTKPTSSPSSASLTTTATSLANRTNLSSNSPQQSPSTPTKPMPKIIVRADSFPSLQRADSVSSANEGSEANNKSRMDEFKDAKEAGDHEDNDDEHAVAAVDQTNVTTSGSTSNNATTTKATTTSSTNSSTKASTPTSSSKSSTTASTPTSRRKHKHNHFLISVTEDPATPTAENSAPKTQVGKTASNVTGWTPFSSLATPVVSGMSTLAWALENVVRNGDLVTVVNVRKVPTPTGRSVDGWAAARKKDAEAAQTRLQPIIHEVIRRSRRKLHPSSPTILVECSNSESEVLLRIATEENLGINKVVMRDTSLPVSTNGGGGDMKGGSNSGSGSSENISASISRWVNIATAPVSRGINWMMPSQAQIVSEKLMMVEGSGAGSVSLVLVTDSMIKLMSLDHYTVSDDDDVDEVVVGGDGWGGKVVKRRDLF
ncbi:hypothetical protein HDU76_005650 [Blyttiomyces sp. JEL0837]|nr:hypothetical protein HDU76_005650 [Blyttiomyces sp. JEL0837]